MTAAVPGSVCGVREVMLKQRPLTELAALLPADQAARFEAAAARAREVLAGRIVWNISATETGGGVAEMLHTLLGYLAAAGGRDDALQHLPLRREAGPRAESSARLRPAPRATATAT